MAFNSKNRSTAVYIVIFLIAVLILKFIGIVNYSFTEFAAYLLIFAGVAAVYSSMGKNEKKLLFAGVIAFLIGIELFITSKFEIVKLSNVVLPSLFFILGTAFLVLFIDETSNRILFTISIIFFAASIFFFVKLGTINFYLFPKSLLKIIINLVPVLIITAALILFLRRNHRN